MKESIVVVRNILMLAMIVIALCAVGVWVILGVAAPPT